MSEGPITPSKESFKAYLSTVNSQKTGKPLSPTAIYSYSHHLDAKKLFDYNPNKWSHIKDIYQIQDVSQVELIIKELEKDPDFKRRDTSGSKYYRSGAIKYYRNFLANLSGEPLIPVSDEIEIDDEPTQTIFFGAPGTGKSYKVNSILPNESVWKLTGEKRKKLFKNSNVAKKSHYADVLSNESKFGGNIWNINELASLEKKLSEVYSTNNISNPEHSALQAYIKFLKEYKIEQSVFRTTFHPDYDYTQFVGAYKPKKIQHNDSGLLSEEQLAQKLSETFPKKGSEEHAKTIALALFGLQYVNSLKDKATAKIVKLSGIGDSRYIGATISAVVKARSQLPDIENEITYSFVPQVFANAYAEAWKRFFDAGNASTAENQIYLVIEEINRGNCAQIFGDIFQLLDRKDEGNEKGFSQYSIDADCDFAEWLKTDDDGLKSVWDKYEEAVGEGKLKLPPNLNILATMNTSDQSLFPMDSAFKRRFDWKYVPIKYAKDDDCGENWDADEFKIVVGDTEYKWLDFLKKVNADIFEVTRSEDKQMGEFFIKPKDDKTIPFEDFRSKVLFYLWDSVYKDETEKQAVFHFPYGDGDDKIKSVTFQSLFDKNAEGIANKIMENLEVEKVTA